MMNAKVGKKMNQLRKLATPMVVYADAGMSAVASVSWPAGNTTQTIIDIIQPILDRYEAEAISVAVMRAATAGAEAETQVTSLSWDGQQAARLFRHCANPILWEIAEAEVRAAVAAHNTRTAREYEAYRLACEQGVAVEPSEGT